MKIHVLCLVVHVFMQLFLKFQLCAKHYKYQDEDNIYILLCKN